jgi:hypothetical protein
MLQTLFIYMLLLPDGQKGEFWEPPKSNALSEIGKHWTKKNNFTCFLIFKELMTKLLHSKTAFD